MYCYLRYCLPYIAYNFIEIEVMSEGVNTTSNILNPQKEEKPTFIGRYFDDTVSFLKFFKFNSTEQAAESMIGLCKSTGNSRGVSASGYLLDALNGFPYSSPTKPLNTIIIIHDNVDPKPNIKGFLILNKQDNETVYLSLICSKAKGGGSYMLEHMQNIALNKNFEKIELEAVEGVSSVYEKRGFEFVEIGPDNLPIMELKLQNNETEDNELYYINRFGRKIKYVRGMLNEQELSNPNKRKRGNDDVNEQPSKKGGKRRKTHKNGNKKRRNTRRRR